MRRARRAFDSFGVRCGEGVETNTRQICMTRRAGPHFAPYRRANDSAYLDDASRLEKDLRCETGCSEDRRGARAAARAASSRWSLSTRASQAWPRHCGAGPNGAAGWILLLPALFFPFMLFSSLPAVCSSAYDTAVGCKTARTIRCAVTSRSGTARHTVMMRRARADRRHHRPRARRAAWRGIPSAA